MSSPASFPVALWLIPAPHHWHRFDKVIAELAIEHVKHEFPPHATLCSGDLDGGDLGASLRKLFTEVDEYCIFQRPFTMRFPPGRPVEQRPNQWNQFLFLPLEANDAPPEALDVCRAQQAFPSISNLKLSTDSDDPARVMPHVSLMYSGLDEHAVRTAARATDSFLPDSVDFAGLWIVSPRSGNWADFVRIDEGSETRWDVIYQARLREDF